MRSFDSLTGNSRSASGRPMKTFLPLILALFLEVPAFASHPCVQGTDIQQISRCFEPFAIRERLEGVRDSVDAVLPMLKGWQYEFTVRLFDPVQKLTREDAVEIYRQVQKIFEEALVEARAQGKPLIFIGG